MLKPSQISFILPLYKNQSCLQAAVQSIAIQTNDDVEFIVVDSSPQPMRLDIFSHLKNFQYIYHEQQKFAGSARNEAVAKTSKEILCFLDSDCLWDAGFWKTLVSLDQELRGDWACLTGQVTYQEPSQGIDFSLHLMEFHEYLSSKRWQPRFLASGNLIIRKKSFFLLGGYREDIPMCEDISMCSKISDDFLRKCLFEPELRIIHQRHLTEPHSILKKVEKMGYWRGYVDKQLPPSLQITSRNWVVRLKPYPRILGLIFFAATLLRSLMNGNIYFLSYFSHIKNLSKLYNLWSHGFYEGLDYQKKSIDLRQGINL